MKRLTLSCAARYARHPERLVGATGLEPVTSCV